ncbi:hypothetical protein TRFO_18329 [Tritrichomonas foetus]|uniref:Protein kinase domain-containing protein n=1 Tax=Tritrichomonas foetus TaxID=1144522 RepID=A0A1J4KQJ2_9EUKA|nr:hypothetical protein TRFO_18329 [Tritrichomonas foetus]|eukprot:OHT11958.1 hypothetical protein TRFO_18329 [Tritrichomonas foetus]
MDSGYQTFIINSDDYKNVKKLNNGRFGQLYLVQRGGVYYVKREVYQDPSKPNDTRAFMIEVDFFMIVRQHPAITKFYGFAVNPNSIIIEFAPNNSLGKVLEDIDEGSPPPWWTPTTRAKAIFGFAAAMQHLHSYDVVHRYLTPSNILFDAKYEIRLSDFGFSKIPIDTTCMSDINSLPIYTAPEAIEHNAYGSKVDVYSFGILVYQILTNCSDPFPGKKTVVQLSKDILSGRRPVFPRGFNPFLKKMLKSCWDANPEARPCFIDILRALRMTNVPLLDGVNMTEYESYKERLIEDTNMIGDDDIYFRIKQITPENRAIFEQIKERADGGDPEAQLHVGKMYDVGEGTEPCAELAFTYFEMAAENGNAIAKYNLSKYLEVGKGTEVDKVRSAQLMKEAAEQGYDIAYVKYARKLEKGIGVESNPAEALKIYKTMADPPNSLKEAMYEYGRMIFEPARGIEENAEEGVRYLMMSSDRGYELATMDYAKALILGKGVPKNVAEGMRIYQQGMVQKIPTAIFNIGKCYEKGENGLKQDIEKAASLYKEAANLGHINAMAQYGTMLTTGKGVPMKDPITAAHYFKKAAKFKNPLACHNYANFLFDGMGLIKVDRAKAIKYYIKANNPNSFRKLASIYYTGTRGISRDLKLTKFYLQKAAELGSRQAAEDLKTLDLGD